LKDRPSTVDQGFERVVSVEFVDHRFHHEIALDMRTRTLGVYRTPANNAASFKPSEWPTTTR